MELQQQSYPTLGSSAPDCSFPPFPIPVAKVFVSMPQLAQSMVLSLLRCRSPCPQPHLVWEGFKAGSHGVPAAELGGLKAANDVLQGGSHHKVLLLQPQLLAFKELPGATQPSALQLPAKCLHMLLSTPVGIPTGLLSSTPREGKCGCISTASDAAAAAGTDNCSGQQNLPHPCCSHRARAAPSLTAIPFAGGLDQEPASLDTAADSPHAALHAGLV